MGKSLAKSALKQQLRDRLAHSEQIKSKPVAQQAQDPTSNSQNPDKAKKVTKQPGRDTPSKAKKASADAKQSLKQTKGKTITKNTKSPNMAASNRAAPVERLKNIVPSKKLTLQSKPTSKTSPSKATKQPKARTSPTSEDDMQIDFSDGSELSDNEVMTCDPNDQGALTKLQQEMQRKLEGAQFRYLNEQLYSTDSKHAFEMMQQQPHLSQLYHAGFRNQASEWPENPVEKIRDAILEFTKPGSVIADIGCGEAQLAKELKAKGFAVHSYDLVENPPHVVAANMTNLPLQDSSVDVAVFSLSLMNTDWGFAVAEACRVLKKGGTLRIAEVKSRIPDLDEFVGLLESLGLTLMNKDESNPMFVMLTLRRKAAKVAKDKARLLPPLKPCIYKRR